MAMTKSDRIPVRFAASPTADSARLIRLAAGRTGAQVPVLWLVAENGHLPGPAGG
jgi:hypothetical protein